MRRYLTAAVLSIVLIGGVASQEAPYKASVSFGFRIPTELPVDFAAFDPCVELGFFHEVIPMERPDFYDLGARVGLTLNGGYIAAGVRHKMYFSPIASMDQEVLVGIKLGPVDALLLTGRFGGGIPLTGGDSAHPKSSVDLALTWALEWPLAYLGGFDARLGLSIGFGGAPF
jgi:hypothetical protein